MPATPRCPASSVRPMSWRVFDPVVPAITGTVTAFTIASNRVSFSSIDNTGDSPVVPDTTRPSLPCSTSHLASDTAASTSSSPSSSNGVTMAVSTRPKRAISDTTRTGQRAIGQSSLRFTVRNLFDDRRFAQFDSAIGWVARFPHSDCIRPSPGARRRGATRRTAPHPTRSDDVGEQPVDEHTCQR